MPWDETRHGQGVADMDATHREFAELTLDVDAADTTAHRHLDSFGSFLIRRFECIISSDGLYAGMRTVNTARKGFDAACLKLLNLFNTFLFEFVRLPHGLY